MYYTHEYSDEVFEVYADCKDELIMNMDISEYSAHISIEEIFRKFFRRKSSDEFCIWLENKVFEAEDAIAEELITIHEEESEE